MPREAVFSAQAVLGYSTVPLMLVLKAVPFLTASNASQAQRDVRNARVDTLDMSGMETAFSLQSATASLSTISNCRSSYA